jgi:hypothetical protein
MKAVPCLGWCESVRAVERRTRRGGRRCTRFCEERMEIKNSQSSETWTQRPRYGEVCSSRTGRIRLTMSDSDCTRLKTVVQSVYDYDTTASVRFTMNQSYQQRREARLALWESPPSFCLGSRVG